ncbi:MAG TPA: hypothetical protein VG871_02495, partial [Vicinamibacterales bacterium]|nr:hypothetical protein [Vicinamibacterales bacterium]
ERVRTGTWLQRMRASALDLGVEEQQPAADDGDGRQQNDDQASGEEPLRHLATRALRRMIVEAECGGASGATSQQRY